VSAAEKVTALRPVIAEDDGVRERHGCTINSQSNIGAFEDSTKILIRVSEYSSYWTSLDASLTPRQARYLARKLYHLARRVEKRELVQ